MSFDFCLFDLYPFFQEHSLGIKQGLGVWTVSACFEQTLIEKSDCI
jgi:hypothetical protein